MASTFKELIEVVHDPELPYSEVNTILSVLAGHILSKLKDTICATIDAAKSKGDAHKFLVVHIKKVVDSRALHLGFDSSPQLHHVSHTTRHTVQCSQMLYGWAQGPQSVHYH